MFVVDTHVVLCAAGAESEFHELCRSRLEEWRREPAPWFLTWGICYEFFRVSTHPRVFRTPWSMAGAWSFLEAVLSSPGASLLLPTQRHRALLGATLAEVPDVRGNLAHDLHTAVLMREHGVSRIVPRHGLPPVSLPGGGGPFAVMELRPPPCARESR